MYYDLLLLLGGNVSPLVTRISLFSYEVRVWTWLHHRFWRGIHWRRQLCNYKHQLPYEWDMSKKNAKAIYKLKIKLKENLHIQIPFLSHFLTSISSSFMAMDYVDICTLGDQVDNAQTRMVINIRESTSYATRWRLLFKHAWTKATTNTNDINFILIYLEINLNNKI